MSKTSRSQSFPRAQKSVGQRQDGFFTKLKRRLRIGSKGSYSIGDSLDRLNVASSDQYSSGSNVNNQIKTLKESISDGEMGHNIAHDFDSLKAASSSDNFRIEASQKKHKSKSVKANGHVGVGRPNGHPEQQFAKLPSHSEVLSPGNFVRDDHLIDNNFILHEEKAIDLDDDVFTVAKPTPLHGGAIPPALSEPVKIDEEPGYETLEDIRKQIDEIETKRTSGISVNCGRVETANSSSNLKEQTSKTSLDSGLGSPESQSPHLDLSSSDNLETRMVSSFHTVHSASGNVQVEIINGTDEDIYANAQIPIRKKSVKKSQSVPNNVGSDTAQRVQDLDLNDYEKVFDCDNSNSDVSKSCNLQTSRLDKDTDDTVTCDQNIPHGNNTLQLKLNESGSGIDTENVEAECITPPPLPLRKYSRSELEDILSPATCNLTSTHVSLENSDSDRLGCTQPYTPLTELEPSSNNTKSAVHVQNHNIPSALNGGVICRSTSHLTKEEEKGLTGSQNNVVNTVNTSTGKPPERDTGECDTLLRDDQKSDQTNKAIPLCQSSNNLSPATSDLSVSKNRPSNRIRDKTEVEVCRGSVKLLGEVTNLSTNSSSKTGSSSLVGNLKNYSGQNTGDNTSNIAEGSRCTTSSACVNLKTDMNNESRCIKLPCENGSVICDSQTVNTHYESCESNDIMENPEQGLTGTLPTNSCASDVNSTATVETVFVSPVESQSADSSNNMGALAGNRESENSTEDPDFFYHDDEPTHMSLSEVFGSKDPSSVSPMIAARLEKSKRVRGQIDSEAVRAFQESMQQLKECGWYWGPLSSSEAEKKLGNKPDGAFLVRDSANENYILSLTFKSSGVINHTRIEHFKGKFGFWSQPESHGKTTIKDFIEQAMENSRNGQFKYFLRAQGPGMAPIAMHLLYPVSRFKTMRSLMHMCRFQILQVVRRDHVDSLPLPPRINNYLKEHQYYAEIIDDEANDIVGFDLNANQEVTQL